MLKRQMALLCAVCLVALAVGCDSCADRGKMAAGKPDEVDEFVQGYALPFAARVN